MSQTLFEKEKNLHVKFRYYKCRIFQQDKHFYRFRLEFIRLTRLTRAL